MIFPENMNYIKPLILQIGKNWSCERRLGLQDHININRQAEGHLKSFSQGYQISVFANFKILI